MVSYGAASAVAGDDAARWDESWTALRAEFAEVDPPVDLAPLAAWGDEMPADVVARFLATPDPTPARLDALEARLSPPRWERLEAWAARGADVRSLVELADLDPSDLDDDERLRALEVAEKAMAAASAMQQRLLAALGGPEPALDPLLTPEARRNSECSRRQRRSLSAVEAEEWAHLEVGAALRLAPVTAAERLEVAHALHGDPRPAIVQAWLEACRHYAAATSGEGGEAIGPQPGDPRLPRLPGLALLLAHGDVTYQHVRSAVLATRSLSVEECARVEARVLPKAPGQSVGEFRKAVERAVIAVDPAGAEERARRAACERGISTRTLGEGMAKCSLVAPARDVQALATAARALARQQRARLEQACTAAGVDWREVDPGRGALACDALVDLCDRLLEYPEVLTGRPLPRAHGRRPQLVVHLDLPTLAGLADNPAELLGHGPLPPVFARELAPGGSLRRLVSDPVSGHALDLGRAMRFPNQQLADFVAARDRTSRFPHDATPAGRCQVDHRDEWRHGGRTSAANLGLFSFAVHRAKTHGKITVFRRGDGTGVLSTPLGRQYLIQPYDYRPDPRHPDARDP